MSLTGKQTAFVNAYLGEARFNATAAAKIAGYKATSQHSFESIGAENLLKPEIRRVIDEHWKLSRMSAEECLGELTKLARGSGKDQIRALALLSQHHGLLDGKWQTRDQTPLEIQVKYVQPELEKREREVDEWKAGIEKEINELNDKGLAIYNAAREKFADSPDVKAFCELYEKMLGGKPQEEPEKVDENIMLPTEKPLEVEIIPPQRRLAPAPIERMMEVVEVEPSKEMTEPARCRHGNLEGECHVMDIGQDQCAHWYNKRSASRFIA